MTNSVFLKIDGIYQTIARIFVKFSWLQDACSTLPRSSSSSSSSYSCSSSSSSNYIIRGGAVVGVDESQNCNTRFVIEIVLRAKDDK